MDKYSLSRNQFRNHMRRGRELNTLEPSLGVSSMIIKINNAGEATVPFYFTYKYAQMPTITFGYQEQSSVPLGRAPVFSASVIEWITKDRLPNSRIYIGAYIRVICESVQGFSFGIQATATGIAFNGPITNG